MYANSATWHAYKKSNVKNRVSQNDIHLIQVKASKTYTPNVLGGIDI